MREAVEGANQTATKGGPSQILNSLVCAQLERA
jgi:hypothetical protein